MTWHCARCATTYFERPLDGRCDECLQSLTEENMEPNALYAEIDRLKRERDALADVVKKAEQFIDGIRVYGNDTVGGGLMQRQIIRNELRAALAQVRK